ncbi:HD domain-containing protein [Psychrobacter phenylpyruvicus]|uniref:HSP90 family protein n=1 Tax=Psychrobacter phenylpyruvicus TaxID=29432 RepID=A0A379LLP8_9GAMM|nr:hypothetical protein [Psychrobacter phenylpyruvicus]SUD91478.1 HSP90 family protein [Psychrobacter phenylpyruvicus]
MSAGLIKHLKDKTEQDPNTKILMSQWEFDEKLVGKSLENVGSYYPHFSSHNESHSQQILVNIERLLGDNISKLTATDTWLMLEAAYWHDIGMLFSADDVQEVVNNEKFKDYVEELANNNAQDLHEFAKVWHNEGWEVALVSYDNPYKGVEKYRQMVAEWYRRDHPQNSQQVVLKPFEKLNISSPRTELLPQRIYSYLAQICLSHGKSFNYVMSELPFRQTGMGTENCHPRFVACMLRLGDLFDIDDNRFCPVMARQVGNMPSLSETHKHKHQAIREFQLDNETVSVTAICNTEMSYIECRRWFDWIKEEIQNQMSQWKNIVPSREFGLLPTINKLDVEMADSKILLNDKPMKFSLDEKSVIELLQGNNLYSGIIDVFRELIQNAIDATLIRIWIDAQQYPEKILALEKGSPYDSKVIDIIKDYSIKLDLELIKTTDSLENIWKLIIKDDGTGISLEDLKYMQYMGGSNRNLRKRKVIKNMPIWMRPSGTFGIGLHSAFLLNKNLPSKYQHLKFITKNIFDHTTLEVRLNSPLGKDDGFCFINQLEPDLSLNYGTTTELYFKTDVIASSFLVDEALYDLSDLLVETYNTFNRNSPKIVYNEAILEKSEQYQYSINENYDKHTIRDIAWLKFKDCYCAVEIFVPDTICTKNENHYSYNGFRGQDIPSSRETMDALYISHNVSIYLDVYGEAKHFVTINRNDWQYSAIQTTISDIKNTILKQDLTEENKARIVHGFEYNKKLGFEIIRRIILENFEIDDISDFLFNKETSVKEMLTTKIFLTGGKNINEEIRQELVEALTFKHIDIYPQINDFYYDATIKFFKEHSFKVYRVSKQSQEYPLRITDDETLLFIKPDESNNIDIQSLLKDFEVTELPKKQSDQPLFESDPDFFTDIILHLDSRLSSENIILINDFYKDYYLFESFSFLSVKVNHNYVTYSFDYDNSLIGIIFPFYVQNKKIHLHDLDKLYTYVSKKSIKPNLPMETIQKGYIALIKLIKDLTKESPIWAEFFKNSSLEV